MTYIKVLKGNFKSLRLALVNICLLFGTYSILYNIQMTSTILDELLLKNRLPSVYDISVWLGINLIFVALKYFQINGANSIMAEVHAELSGRVIRTIACMKREKFCATNTGDYLRIKTSMDQMISVFNTFMGVTQDIVKLLLITMYLASKNLILAFISIIFVFIVVVSTRSLNKNMMKSYSDLSNSKGIFLSDIQNTFKAIPIIKSYSIETLVSNKLLKTSTVIADETLSVKKKETITSAIAVVIGLLPIVICIYFSAFLVSQKLLSVGAFIVIIPLISGIAGIMSTILNSMVKFNREKFHFDEVLSFINANTEVVNSDFENDYDDDYAVEFIDVSIKFSGQYILKNCSFKIERGSKVAICGDNGAGKSTILALMTKMVSGYTGIIKVNGVDIEQLGQEAIMNKFSIYNDKQGLLNTTLLNNFQMCGDGGSIDDIKRILEIFCMSEWLAKSNEGLDTVLEGANSELSGGERQRMILARMQMNVKEIIFMDEPTSSLDQSTAEKVLSMILSANDKATIMVVAHDTTLINRLDKILMVKEGKVELVKSSNATLSSDGFYPVEGLHESILCHKSSS